jgi:hypothetical protein
MKHFVFIALSLLFVAGCSGTSAYVCRSGTCMEACDKYGYVATEYRFDSEQCVCSETTRSLTVPRSRTMRVHFVTGMTIEDECSLCDAECDNACSIDLGNACYDTCFSMCYDEKDCDD